MDDAISRQAALNEFCHSCDGWSCNPNTCCKTEWIRKLPTIYPEHGTDCISRQQAIETFKDCAVNGVGIDGIVDALEQLPTIQSSIEKWIPVTERLPEENQPVLITDGAVMWVCSLVRTDDGYKWESNMGYWHDFDEWKAWMPLPEPYKGATEWAT